MKTFTKTLAVLASTSISPLYAAEIVLPQNRTAFHSSEAIEIAVADLKNETATVELAPDKAGLAPLRIEAKGPGTVTFRVPPHALAPAIYQMKLNGHWIGTPAKGRQAATGVLTVTSGVPNSTMFHSQTGRPKGMKDIRETAANFLVGHSFNYGLVDRDGAPALEVQGNRSSGMKARETAIEQDLPSIIYMYWTGFVTHKPWGIHKSWANEKMVETMRLFNFHNAQWLRRFSPNILMVGTLDEPGLAWGKTPAGGSASGFPNWDEKPWYEKRGWEYTNDPSSRSDADWMKYINIRSDILKENNQWARDDLKKVWPEAVFSTDLYAPQAIMDGTDPMNQTVNDIPSTHVFMDYGTGKLGVIGAMYLEKAHDPSAKVAHAMNGQLFGHPTPSENQRPAYRLALGGMMAAGLHSNWWLNARDMGLEDLHAVNEAGVRLGPLFQEMAPNRHDVAVLWSKTELAMRQKAHTAKEAQKKTGEQIMLMVSEWPETNDQDGEPDPDGKRETTANAYSIGTNYKDEVLTMHRALSRAGYPAHVVHEDLLTRGVLKNYKTLVVAAQTFDFSQPVQKAIADFVAAGGRVVTDKATTVTLPQPVVTDARVKDATFRWGIPFGKRTDVANFKNAREASYHTTNYFMDELARENTPLALASMRQTASKPVFTSESVHLAGERHFGGEGQMLMVLNGHEILPKIAEDQLYPLYNYQPLQATYTLQGIPAGSAVYLIEGEDWKKSSRVTNFSAPQKASFAAGETKLYLVAPRAPAGLNITAQAANGVLRVNASLMNLKMPWPLTVTVRNAAGDEVFRVHRATKANGEYSEAFPIGANSTGTLAVTVESPVANLKAQATANASTALATASLVNEPVRVFDETAIKQLLAGKQPITVVVGNNEQNGQAQKIAQALQRRGVPVKVLPEAQVWRKARYPRVWDPFIKVFKPTGQEGTVQDMEVKSTITIETKTDGELVALTPAGAKLGVKWQVPNTLATVVGEGFIDYKTEQFYEPGVKLYVSDARELRLKKIRGVKPVEVVYGEAVELQTTDEAKQKWSRPWNSLGSYVGQDKLPPKLPEAYEVDSHLILLGDSTQSTLIRALQASELLLQTVNAKYPGPGKALVQYAWSPFGLEKDIIFIGAGDAAGVNAGVDRLIAAIN